MKRGDSIKIIVTTGGLKERVDDKISITSSSKGELGIKFVKEFLNEYPNCSIFCIHGENVDTFTDYRVKFIEVKNTQDLIDTITDILTNNKIDIFLNSMDIMNYRTSYIFDIEKLKEQISKRGFEGIDELIGMCKVENKVKISSNVDSPAVVLEKTPKVLKKVKELSPNTYLIGLKLLDSVIDNGELYEKGYDFLCKNQYDMVLANNFERLKTGDLGGLIIFSDTFISYTLEKDDDNLVRYLVVEILKGF